MLTDHVVLVFLADVFILESHRGKGLSTWLMEIVMDLPELQSIRRWFLGTRDAHDLSAIWLQ